MVRLATCRRARRDEHVPPVVEFFPDRARELARRMEEAQNILRDALARLGIEVHPGIFLEETFPFLTSPEGLWSW